MYFLLALGLILLASLLIVRTASGRSLSDVRPYLDLFFMGAAFLLLETMNVVRFALWFGTTWFVNALVFFGILVAVLLAIEVARRVRLPRPSILYALLAATLVDRVVDPAGRPCSISRGAPASSPPPAWRSFPSSWRT